MQHPSPEQRPALRLIGLEVRASNDEAHLLGAHWQRFGSPDVAAHLGGRATPVIYAVYADYDGDHTQPYTFFLGHAFDAEAAVPDGFVVRDVPAGTYTRVEAVGPQPAALIEAWMGIWDGDIPRSFELDYEVHDPADPARVVIYVR